MNTVYFWKDIDAGFARLARNVQKRVVIGIAPPEHLKAVGFDKEGYRLQEMPWYEERLRATGFETRVQRSLGDDSCGLLIGDKASEPNA